MVVPFRMVRNSAR